MKTPLAHTDRPDFDHRRDGEGLPLRRWRPEDVAGADAYLALAASRLDFSTDESRHEQGISA